MQLRELDIVGFKSFAHKTTLYFDKGLTVIIGPNGSGKSNVTEAIKWVLGEQSLKSLRGGKSEDVIFAGSPTQARVGQARVQLTFDNQDQRLPIEASEVAITRSVNRSGESEYVVNRDPIRLLDLQHLLAQAGIGTRSYTVISQGMVDRYLTATPAARRELFDEACGIKTLQLKVKEAQRKLRQTHTHAQELQRLVQELEPQVRVLARQMARQAERTELLAQYQTKQGLWFTQAWHLQQQTIQTVQTNLAKQQMHIEQARAAREAIDAALFAALAEVPVKLNSQRPGTRVLLQACYDFLADLETNPRFDAERLHDLLDSLQRALQATPKSSPETPYQAQLTAARQTEVTAERAGSALQAELAQAQAELQELEQTILRERGSAFWQHLQASTYDPDSKYPVTEEVETLASRLQAIGELDPLIAKEYEEARVRLETIQTQLTDILSTGEHLQQLIKQLERQMDTQFREQFQKINRQFQTYFTRLFNGGSATLQLLEVANSLVEEPGERGDTVQGIEISVQPPTKHRQRLSALSGGEKALTALALLFAILDIQQPPFLVLDEVDAPLDEANSYRFAELLKEKSQTTQCLVITHNRATMGQADVLYGVTMQQDGISHVYSVKLSEL